MKALGDREYPEGLWQTVQAIHATIARPLAQERHLDSIALQLCAPYGLSASTGTFYETVSDAQESGICFHVFITTIVPPFNSPWNPSCTAIPYCNGNVYVCTASLAQRSAARPSAQETYDAWRRNAFSEPMTCGLATQEIVQAVHMLHECL